MPRTSRITYDHCIYHIIARGNQKHHIYHHSKDKQKFLDLLSHSVNEYRWICHVYCLMPNHYHLLLETPENSLSEGMHWLNLSYTAYYKKIYPLHTGHLFQSRFKSIILERNSHLLELCRYIVLNPVRANFVKKPQTYQWSSYRATAGLITHPPFLTVDWIRSQFSEDSQKAHEAYRKFVGDGLSLKTCPQTEKISAHKDF